jgi:hypothetical protein
LKDDDSHSIKWHINAAFAVHHNKKSHTGANMLLGNGSVYSTSTKQNKCSTEAELVSIDDVLSKILWETTIYGSTKLESPSKCGILRQYKFH